MPVPSEAQLRTKDRITNPIILEQTRAVGVEKVRWGDGEKMQEKKYKDIWGESDESLCLGSVRQMKPHFQPINLIYASQFFA